MDGRTDGSTKRGVESRSTRLKSDWCYWPQRIYSYKPYGSELLSLFDRQSILTLFFFSSLCVISCRADSLGRCDAWCHIMWPTCHTLHSQQHTLLNAHQQLTRPWTHNTAPHINLPSYKLCYPILSLTLSPPHQPLLIPFHIFKINFLIYINFQIHHPELLPLSLWPNFSWLLYLTRILTFASLPLIWLSFLLMLTYCFFIFPCPCTLVIYVFLFIFSFVLSRRKKSFGTFTCISQVIINQSSKNRWEN